MNSLDELISHNFKLFLKEKEFYEGKYITKKEVAKDLGITENRFRSMLILKTHYDLDTIDLLADYLSIPPIYLFKDNITIKVVKKIFESRVIEQPYLPIVFANNLTTHMLKKGLSDIEMGKGASIKTKRFSKIIDDFDTDNIRTPIILSFAKTLEIEPIDLFRAELNMTKRNIESIYEVEMKQSSIIKTKVKARSLAEAKSIVESSYINDEKTKRGEIESTETRVVSAEKMSV